MKKSFLFALLLVPALVIAGSFAPRPGPAGQPAFCAFGQEESGDEKSEGETDAAPPEDDSAGKDNPVDLSMAPAPRHELMGKEKENPDYSRVEWRKDANLPNFTFTYKVFDAAREFKGRLIVRKFEAEDLRFGRLTVLDKEYMFEPQRVVRMAYRKENFSPVFMWMTYEFGDEEKKFTADYYYDQIFIRDEGEKVFYHNNAPNPPQSFDLDQLVWILRTADLEKMSGWKLLSINVPTLEESYQVRVTREEDVEVKGADFKRYQCAHLVLDYGFVTSEERVKEHYYLELLPPHRLIQYVSGNLLFLYESEKQGGDGEKTRKSLQIANQGLRLDFFF